MKALLALPLLATMLVYGQHDQGAVQKRIEIDKKNALKPFTIMPHRPNFMLLGSYNTKGYEASIHAEEFSTPDYRFKDIEAQFQLSLKVPIALDFFSGRLNVYGAYTNRSFWQVYNPEISSPFRETNHEPELWFQVHQKNRFLGFNNPLTIVGISHQSNGRSGILSRSWNRVYAVILLQKGRLAISLKPWFRLSEDKEDDDNPDIKRYMGHGETRLVYTRGKHTFSAMLRNVFESDFKRAGYEFSWSIPFYKYDHFRGYLQAYSGYGESLIDYNHKVNRIALGISITDFL
ncbi:MAG: phospholipase [Acidobacteria bacterium]|nr:MAG: phospholipase [Acidobacteriota bacterium]